MGRNRDLREPSTTEVIADYRCEVGENPLWHPIEKRLYWADISTGRLFWFDPISGQHEKCYSGRPVGGFTIQHDGSLLLFKDRGTITSWRDGEEQVIVSEIEAERELRFNDVIADPKGRVFCGTFQRGHKGRLYRLDSNGELSLLLDDIGCSNGMAFSPDLRSFYHTDSFAGIVHRYDYDLETGTLSNQRTFTSVPSSEGFPDGCTVDAEGCFWYALWGGSRLVRLDPRGAFIDAFPLPARKVTSLTFAGEQLNDIYVTSEGGQDRRHADPYAGALFRIRTEGHGKPDFFSRVGRGQTTAALNSHSLGKGTV